MLSTFHSPAGRSTTISNPRLFTRSNQQKAKRPITNDINMAIVQKLVQSIFEVTLANFPTHPPILTCARDVIRDSK